MDATLMFYLWEIGFLFLTSLFSAPVFAKRFCAVLNKKGPANLTQSNKNVPRTHHILM